MQLCILTEITQGCSKKKKIGLLHSFSLTQKLQTDFFTDSLLNL